MLMALFGLVFGLIFGLLLAWGVISLVYAMVGMVILLLGALVPSMFRPVFGAAILGFLLSWIVSGGLSLL
jgi:hypothetical protein